MKSVFSQMLRNLLAERGWTQNDLARRMNFNKGFISKLVNGKQRPSEYVARQMDDLFNARGELIAAGHLDTAAARDTKPTYTSELLQRIHTSDTSSVTLESLSATVLDLSCQYAQQDAMQLRTESHGWLREISRLLKQPVGLKEHRELLVNAGWLALLVGCVEYDLGMRASAEATRVTAAQLAKEADAPEILGWTHEMSAWFALTQGRYNDVLKSVESGLEVAGNYGVAVQLAAQNARTLGRMGNMIEGRRSLDKGQHRLDQLEIPDRTDNHFVIDPAKWNFYAMDAYRQAQDDQYASQFALEVIQHGTTSEGLEISPMRVAEARLTLAVSAARTGNLDEAIGLGFQALQSNRRSLPSLLTVASELDSELNTRFPNEDATLQFQEHLRMLH